MIDQLTTEYAKGPRDYFAGLIRRKWSVFLCVAVISGLSLLLATWLPPVYRSTATVLVEQPDIPDNLVRTTVTSFANERIQIITQRVMTTENLAAVIDKYNLYEDERGNTSITYVAEIFRNAIDLVHLSADITDRQTHRASTSTIAFSLSFSHKDPRLAQEVANEIVSLYLSENLQSRKKKASETSDFLDTELLRVSKELSAEENRFSAFKEKHATNLPEHLTYKLRQIERIDDGVTTLVHRRQVLDERITYLQSQLAVTDRKVTNRGIGDSVRADPKFRIDLLQIRLATLSATYGSAHPQVIQTKREIAALEKFAEFEASISGNTDTVQLKNMAAEMMNEAAVEQDKAASPEDTTFLLRRIKLVENRITELNSPGTSVTSNPAFSQLQTQLNVATTERASLVAKEAELRNRKSAFETSLRLGPRIEQQYRAMQRNLQHLSAKYESFNNKLTQARLAEAVEVGRKGERFSLIEAPQLPNRPTSPNRPLIVAIGLVFAVVTGLSIVVISENFDERIHGIRQLSAMFGEPPLVVVPRIVTAADRRRHLASRLGIGAVSVLLCAAILVLVHRYFVPLDVLMAAIERKYTPF